MNVVRAFLYANYSAVPQGVYHGRKVNGRFEVWVNGQLLPPYPDTPHASGYSWGYHGHSPPRLSQVLLYHCLGKKAAEDYDLVERFTEHTTVKLPRDSGWDLSQQEVCKIVGELLAQREKRDRIPR